MKVLLIQPSTFRKNYGEYAEAGGKNQPLGICYLAAILEKNNIPTKILDADTLNLTLEETFRHIDKYMPLIIGISTLTTTFPYVKILAKEIKKKYPSIFIVVGGAHITAMPEQSIKNKCFDFGVIGEGEYTFLKLVQTLLDKKSYKNIEGIIYKKDRKIIKTKPRKLIEDLDELPFPTYHLLPSIKLYRPQIHSMKATPIASIITSRGCPFQCIYCDKSVFGSKYRVRSPKNVVDEIEYLINKFGVKEIIFCDDNFTLIKKRVSDICDEILKRKLKIYWSCSVRADNVDKKLLEKMKSSGCWLIALGIESGNQKILEISKKNISLDIIKKVVKWSNEFKIKVRGYFMLGLPGETKESIEDTINFAKSLKLNTAEFTICTPFPNTPLYNNISKYGKLDDSDFSRFSQMFPVFTPNGLSSEYLIRKQREAHRKFYLRPSKIFDFILQIRSLNDIKRYWTGFKIVVRSIF